MTRFAACVRRHGAPNFPDPPYSAGELNDLGFRKNSPVMTRATQDCHADALAAGVVQTQAEQAAHMKALLKIAQCMRANGVPNFPDPSSSGLGLTEPVVESPRYAAAAKKCDAAPPPTGKGSG